MHPSHSLRRLTPLALAIQIACGVALPGYSGAASAQAAAPARQYDIPAGALGPALNQFALQAGVSIVAEPAKVQGLRTQGLKGSYNVSEGFERLLRGTGHAVAATDAGYVLVAAAVAATAATADAPQTLPAITATGVAEGASEHSGLYTMPVMSSATRLGLSARDTPQSVSVITRQQLDDQAVQSVQEVMGIAPGVTITQLDSDRFTFSARGFAIDNLQYDGVPTQYTTQYGAGESELDLILYDRLEIVRGATGLLTGAGDPSAAINLIRKRADSHVLAGTLTASAGSWDNYRASLDLSAPLSHDGSVRGRIVASHEDKDSYIDNYSRQRSTLYAALGADLNAATAFNAGISYQRGRANGVTYGGFPLVYSNGASIDWRSYGRSLSIWPRWANEDTDSTNAFAELAHEWANGWKTTALAMYSRQKVDNTRVFPSGYPDPVTGVNTPNTLRGVKFPGERNQRSLDVTSSGTFNALGRQHDAAFGVSYSRQKNDFDRIGPVGAAPVISLFDWANYPEPAWGSPAKSAAYDRRQSGAYGVVRVSLADPLKLIVGGRFNRWERSGVGYLGRNPYDFDQSKFTPYAGVVYELGKNYSVYGSYTSIYNPQNYQDRNGDFIDPTQGRNLEAGIKGAFLDGRVQASAALFRVRQDNVATADAGYMVPGTATQAYTGARGVTSKGVELELSGELRRGWNLAFNASHFEAEDANGDAYKKDSPATVIRVFTTYQLPNDWRRLTVGGGANWQSRSSNPTGVYYNSPAGVGEYHQGAYTLASLMARYQITPQVALQLNVDNLFDKWHYTSVNFNEQIIWGAPRSYRATLSYKF